MADFSGYLDTPVDNIERPKALVLGHYHALVKSWKPAERNFAKAGEPPKLVPIITVAFTITGASDDVEDPLADYASTSASKDYDLSDERGLYALRRLVEDTCGVSGKGLNLQDALDAIKGSDVLLYNVPRPGKEEGEFYTNIAQVLPVT